MSSIASSNGPIRFPKESASDAPVVLNLNWVDDGLSPAQSTLRAGILDWSEYQGVPVALVLTSKALNAPEALSAALEKRRVLVSADELVQLAASVDATTFTVRSRAEKGTKSESGPTTVCEAA